MMDLHTVSLFLFFFHDESGVKWPSDNEYGVFKLRTWKY